MFQTVNGISYNMCCAHWEIGAEWGVGLLLAVTWYLALGVTVTHLVVVAGLMLYDNLHKNKKEERANF